MSDSSLLKKIDNEVGGIFWITNSQLSDSSIFFNDLDYIFDGLISEFLFQNKEKTAKTNTFCTKSFGSNLWLVQIDSNTSSSDIDEQVALISSTTNKKIIIVGDTNSKWFNEIPKRYTQIKFESFN